MEEARTDDSFGDIDAWTCPSESVVGGGSLARSRTSPAMVALLLFFFRWVNSTSPSHYWRNALNISSSFLFILTVIYIQYLRTDMKLRHGNFRRWRSESFRISNLPPQMKKVSIGRRYYKPQKILPLWSKRRNLPRNAPLVSALHWLQLKLFWSSVCHDGWLTNDSEVPKAPLLLWRAFV